MSVYDDMMARSNTLKSKWSKRNDKIKKWYDILLLKDELAQEGMESVAGNDPRTGFNLGRHLLVTSIVSHKISQEGLTAEELAGTSYLETYITKRWLEHESRYRTMGKQGFKWQLASWVLASGWHAVFSVVEDDKIWSETWNPFDVYPDFDDEGLSEVVYLYSLSPSQLAKKVKLFEWNDPGIKKGLTTVYNHWGFDDNGDVANTILIRGKMLKEPTVDPRLSKIHHLPVFVAPIGGLPDTGSITGDSQGHLGEALVATNEELTKNYNKMLTYNQQLVRDTANPRWLELSNSENGILSEANMFKRGAIFKGAPGDEVRALPMPPIPVELRQSVMDYQNQLQRGMFPWSVFGNVQQQTSYLALASIASSSMSVLSPYVDDMKGLLSDMCNYWYRFIKENGVRPYGFKSPKILPESFDFESSVDVEIPGYLVQRATVARMLNPQFKLPISLVMSRLFPEVNNPLRAMAESRKDDAMNLPQAITADTILAYREQAKAMRAVDDVEGADLYEKVAKSMESQLFGIPSQPQQPTSPPIQQVQREVMPTREQVPQEEVPQEGI